MSTVDAEKTVTVSYARYRALVSRYLQSMVGLSLDDIADYSVGDSFDWPATTTVAEFRTAARQDAQDALAADGFDLVWLAGE
jgi:hypothetical protein